MIWKFRKIKSGIKVSIKNSETKSSHPLGVTENNLGKALTQMIEYFAPNDIIDTKGIKETIVYKSVKKVDNKPARTLTKEWNHIPVIFTVNQGLPNN